MILGGGPGGQGLAEQKQAWPWEDGACAPRVTVSTVRIPPGQMGVDSVRAWGLGAHSVLPTPGGAPCGCSTELWKPVEWPEPVRHLSMCCDAHLGQAGVPRSSPRSCALSSCCQHPCCLHGAQSHTLYLTRSWWPPPSSMPSWKCLPLLPTVL